MQTTSHFIGVTVGSTQFADLFVALQTYCTDHQICGAVEFQNVLSLHIALYYLGQTLSVAQKAQIAADILQPSAYNQLFQVNARFHPEIQIPIA